MSDWRDGSEAIIEATIDQVNLAYSLNCGQAFRWKFTADGWWTGVIGDQAVRLRQDEASLSCQLYPGVDDTTSFIADYLRLDVDLGRLYADFADADLWMRSAVEAFSGLRVLLQEPQETLLSYICSTANSVPRIAKAVEEMSRMYGEPIAEIDGRQYCAFPHPVRLAEAPPETLWTGCGLGWRGTNLKEVARQLLSLPDGWPAGLRELPYAQAKADLILLRGVGAKIADCVCLFALAKDEAVPVDTHIWAVAREIFDAQIPTRTLTPGTYEAIARLFIDRYGPYAGWAQEYLYLQRRAAQGRVRP